MNALVWVLTLATWLAVAVGAVVMLRWVILHVGCWLAGHDWPQIEPLPVQVVVACGDCGKRRTITPTARCKWCRHDWWDHQEESPNGACAAFPCSCRAYTPRSEP